MKKTLLTLTLVAFGSLSAWGDIIPYPNVGTIAPTVPLLATATGDIDGYFYGFSAGDLDLIQMCDITQGTCSAFGLPNQTTTVGTEDDFGSVFAGDVIVFNLENTDNGDTILSSDPTLSADGINHAYITPYTDTGSTAEAGIPPGIFVGMEDLSLSQGTDLDYNDDQFVFTNVSMNVVPEPSLVILCAGFLVLLPVARRKFGI
jgi:hypothetical protein